MAHDHPNPAYETVAAAIRFVRSHALAQPSLDEVARHVGLSASHLQRVFGQSSLSPNRFNVSAIGRRTDIMPMITEENLVKPLHAYIC